jgi:pimeloyl-ACP methyl ester carboxylesterase
MRSTLLALLLVPVSTFAAAESGRVETAPGVSIYYEKVGNGPKATLIPGRLFLAGDFASLARPERTLIFYDMRNRGASSHVTDGAKLTIIEDVNDLEALRAHFGLQKFDLVGYSYLGLMTALYTATGWCSWGRCRACSPATIHPGNARTTESRRRPSAPPRPRTTAHAAMARISARFVRCSMDSGPTRWSWILHA